jgi:transcriptional regulator with XRE-family HTH domain
MRGSAAAALGARLRELREAAGLTQRQLAKKAGLYLSAVSKFETGVREPVWSNVVALAGALGASLGDFGPPARGKRRAARRDGGS